MMDRNNLHETVVSLPYALIVIMNHWETLERWVAADLIG